MEYVKSFSESNDYGVRDGCEIGNFVGSGAFVVDSTKPLASRLKGKRDRAPARESI
jgi:hypothetical protein